MIFVEEVDTVETGYDFIASKRRLTVPTASCILSPDYYSTNSISPGRQVLSYHGFKGE